MNSHLSQRDLLLYIDGELSLWRSHRVEAHVRSCWKCRRELERLEQDISAIVDAQSKAFMPAMPRPVRPWDNFEALAAALEAPRFGAGVLLRRAATLFSADSLSSLRWATAVVTLICVVVTALWLTPERLSAEIVLERMERTERVRTSATTGQVVRQRLRVERIDRRSSSRQSVEIESWSAGERSVWRGDIRDLKQRYRRLGLESSLPLSPVASERWLRETQAEPKLSRVGNGLELEAKATRRNDDLESVSVRVRSGTWRLEGIRLTFIDNIFDVAELDLTVLNRSALSPALLAELEPVTSPAVNTSRAGRIHAGLPDARPVTGAPAINPFEEELRIQSRLHEISADLSEPIDLSLDQGTVVINARGASDERKQQLTGIFGGDPRIRLETEVSTTSRPGTVAPSIVAGSEVQRRPDKQLSEFFGTPEAQENFTRAVLNAAASVLARLYALRSLAQHWPASVESTLSPESRGQLNLMVDDHVRALRTSQPELSRLLGPLLLRFCTPPEAEPGTSSTAMGREIDWRRSVTTALEAARTVDRNLRALLTTSSNGTSVSEACPELNSGLFRLSSSVGSLPQKP